MADDQSNDEYQFSDADALDSTGVTSTPVEEERTQSPPSDSSVNLGSNQVKRNALIVVCLFVVAMLLYKFMGAYFAERKNRARVEQLKPPAVKHVAAPKKIVSKPEPIKQPVLSIQPTEPTIEKVINKKISGLQLVQENTRSDVSSLTSQMTGVKANVESIMQNLAELNNTLDNLSKKLDSQSHEVEHLAKQLKKETDPKKREAKPHTKLSYYIQAVIPGRAWLMNTAGKTITVREGSEIGSYGKVESIDSVQGLITTTSGRKIRFNPDGN